jgi:hypothetical protein
MDIIKATFTSTLNKAVLTFPFNPESILYKRAVNYHHVQPIGYNNSFRKWVGTDADVLSFTFVLDDRFSVLFSSKVASYQKSGKYECFCSSAIDWLQQHTLSDTGKYPIHNDPPKLIFNYGHFKDLVCIVSSLDFNITKFWANGDPKVVEVNIELSVVHSIPLLLDKTNVVNLK